MANDPEHVRLLTLEADAIFGLEPTSSSSSHHVLRDPALHALLICSPRGGVVTALSRGLAVRRDADPESVVARAAAALAELPRFFRLHANGGAAPPACLVHLQDALGLPGHAVAGGPTWIVPNALRAGPGLTGGLPPPGVRVLTSLREQDKALVTRLPRPSTWEPAGWAAAMGPGAPWAVAVYHEGEATQGGEIVCVCHTPARNAEVAEAGIWTREDWRGKGLAPRVVAAWATAHRPQTRTLFYSTWRENTASQAVARTLGLEEFAYIWKLLVV